MELTSLILLDLDTAEVKWYHRYQHLYAPFLYSFASFYLLFVQDFKFFFQKNHANLHIAKIPTIEWVKMIAFKILYFGLVFGLPMTYAGIGYWKIALAWALVQMVISIFVAFTFFISHHVSELKYIAPNSKNNLVADSWIHHQITTTIDFEPENRIANFIFGGFNVHVAHHVFPEVSHEHYPELTRLIREVLAENNIADWYKSFSFMKGCVSHLQHLKNVAQQAFDIKKKRPINLPSHENSHHFFT